MLAVGTLSESNIDQGTYESDCNVVNGEYSKERLVIRCDMGGNVNEVISYSAEYMDDTCKKILFETSIVASVALVSETQCNSY